MGRGGATSSRGRGKFKVSRGGGRHFSRDLDTRAALKGQVGNESDEEESEEESEEEESSDDDGRAGGADETAKLAPEMAAMNLKLGNTVEVGGADGEEEMSRAERKALKKAQAGKKVAIKEPDSEDEEEEDEGPAKVASKGVNQAPKAKAAPKPSAEMSRREREAADKKAAEERYKKLHAAGKTVEAKTDLARLQEVRQRREAAAAQREAEAAEAARVAAEKKEKAAARRF